MSSEEHKHHAPSSLNFYVITASDTRTEETDTGGGLARELLINAGHTITGHEIVREEARSLKNAIDRVLGMVDVDAIIITGGTGISGRDITPDIVMSILDRKLEGFGEIFRMLSFDEIGTSAMMSRAMAGIAAGKAIFCIPGSRGGVRLAVEDIILKEAGHIIWEAGR